MTVLTGTQGTSATSAMDLYNRIVTEMQANGHWTITSDSPVLAATAGTTADVYIWKCDEGNDFYVCFEPDETNDRIRIRGWEVYDTVAHAQSFGLGTGGSATSSSLTSVTPTTPGFAIDETPDSIGAATPILAYATINVPTAGYYYLYEVRDHLITVATRTSANVNTFCVIGQFASLVQSIPDPNPLIMVEQITNKYGYAYTASATAMIDGVVSRSPGLGGVGTVGAFCVSVEGMHAQYNINGATPPVNDDSLSGIDPNTGPSLYQPGVFTSQAVIHGQQANTIATGRTYRGYLPNFVVTSVDANTPTEPRLGDTIVVGGVAYYLLGYSSCMSTGAVVNDKTLVLAIRSI